jgi:DNA repair exonuclease SbcCD ATPase subunit
MRTNYASDSQLEMTRLRQQLAEMRKRVNRVINLMKRLSDLDQNRAVNLFKIKGALRQIMQDAEGLDGLAERLKDLRGWLAVYQEELKGLQQELQNRFGTELEKELQKRGLSLSGHYPELKSGLFTIELDFDKWQAILWYGPKQERLTQCALSPSEVAKAIDNLRRRLGSQLSEKEFLQRLQSAYQRALISTGGKEGDRVPIIKVLSELAYLLQEPRFYQDPRREHYKGYSRADFSYDLFRVRHSETSGLFHRKLRLVVATRALTRRRQDFLWVPDDETGKGTVYSHLQFEEATS